MINKNINRLLGGMLGLAVLAMFNSAKAQPVPVFTNLWGLAPLTFPGMTTNGNDMRGVAIASLTTNVLISSRVGGTNQGVNLTPNHVNVVDFGTGTNLLAQLKTVPSGSQFNLDKVGVADDGKVYGCNLTTGPTGVNQYFKIYQWPSESDTTTEALYVFDSTNYFNASVTLTNSFAWRMGDYMDVRGSGTNTEIVVVGNSATSTNLVIFRPTDAALTNFLPIIIPTPVAGISFAGSGVAFEGTNNAVWCRQNASQNTRRLAYNPNTLTSSYTHTNTVDQSVCQGLKYISLNGINMLATVQPSSTVNAAHRARVFQIPGTPTGAFVSLLNAATIPQLPGSLNGNALGQVDSRYGHIAFAAPGYGVAFYRVDFVTNSPPTNAVLSVSANPVVAGFNSSLSVTVAGTSPLTYIWSYTDGVTTNTVGSNTNVFTLAPAQVTNTGTYFVTVTNLYGTTTSGSVNLTVLPGKFSSYATNLWSVAPGSRSYLTTTDTQRGIAYDSVNNRIILVSRTPTNAIYVLDANTGADLGYQLDIGTILANPPAPGTFMFNMCGVADDGAVYVGNLITSGGSDSFTIYRWADSSSNSLVGQSYLGNPAVTRLGDTMAVRGSGVNTEILCSFRTGTNVALFTTSDGVNFSETTIPVVDLPADAQANGFAGLGLAFGPGNTFWAKSTSFNLRLVSYDTNTITASVVNTYTNLPISEGPLGADNVNGYVATIGINQTPHNLSLWDVARGQPDAFQLDRELFATSNVNGNGTGAVAVDPVNRRIFALDSNNGLIALSYTNYYVNIGPIAGGGVVTWPGTGDLQSAPAVTGPWADIVGATTPYTNTAPGNVFFRVRR